MKTWPGSVDTSPPPGGHAPLRRKPCRAGSSTGFRGCFSDCSERFAGRESVTGLLIGLAIGAAFSAFALAVWGDAQVALALGLALFASCSVATLVAMSLPWAFQRSGADPAFGSGPLATVVQDLLSIGIYLVIATSLAA